MRISNEALYEQCSSTRISLLVDRARWSLFGHVLRLHAETPAQLAMDFYCQGVEEGEGKVVRGSAITTLPVVLFKASEESSHHIVQGDGWGRGSW